MSAVSLNRQLVEKAAAAAAAALQEQAVSLAQAVGVFKLKAYATASALVIPLNCMAGMPVQAAPSIQPPPSRALAGAPTGLRTAKPN